LERYLVEEGRESQMGEELHEEDEDDLEDFDVIANEL